MKKIKLLFVTFAVFFPMFPLSAETVGFDRAWTAARTFFQHDWNVARRMAPIEHVGRFSAPLTRAGDETPAYYVFNRAGGGFVIIAGDDACTPVLAYSYTNTFKIGADMPENLKEWLDDLTDQIAFIRREIRRDSAAEAAWSALELTTKTGGAGYLPAVKHETPPWSQRAPFNNLTPLVDGKHAVIGCVPLAMGMLMRYHSYPPKGTGALSTYSYTQDNGTVCMIEGFELGHPYEWDKIKHDYSGAYTQEEGDAVARLVYDCGVAVQARFDESTSASTPKMAACAIDYFGFDPGAYHYKRDIFTDAMWVDMLKTELQARPILYSARRDGGGHAFVVDGYDERDFFSVNWGWGGASNGYFAISAFAPSATHQYIYSHGAVFGLKPREGEGGSLQGEYLYYQAGTASSGTVYNGLTPSETIRPRRSFSMVAGFLYNGGIRPFFGEYCIALVDKDGKIKEQISAVNAFNELAAGSGRGYPSVSCFMQSYPLEGDRVCLLYRSGNWPEGVWERPFYDLTSNIVAEIPVSDDTELADVTSFSYNKTTGEILIETKDLVDWTLTDASGMAVTDGISYSMTALKIAASALQAGSYTLTLKRFDEQLTLNFKTGSK